jgi:ABC-type branched-subunit amino acid transport system substrate-binding protein
MRAKRWGRGLALALAALVSGCQTVVPRGPPPTAEHRPQPNRPTQPGRIEPGIPQDVSRNRVALLVPLTGPNAGIGQSLANATQLALLDSNSDRIRITNYDTNQGASIAAQKALADGNGLILGPLLAEDARAVAPVAKRAGVPVISFSNDVSVAGNGVYVLGYSPAQAIARVVEYAKSRGVSSYGGLFSAGLYGERASTSFLRAVEGAGGQVLSLQTYEHAPGAATAAVARMAKTAPYDAVLIADSAGMATAVVPMLRRSSPTTHVLGTEQWNSESSFATKPALNGAWFASVSDALYRQFVGKYRARFSAAPYRLSSLGYDAVLLSVRIANDWKPGAAFPTDRLGDRGGFVGIDGAFRFGRDGIAERALEVQEVRGAGVVVVSPAPTGF